MKRFKIGAIALLAMLVFTSSSSAGTVWTDAISYDGLIDNVQDNSVSTRLGKTLMDPVVEGDIIVGILQWNENNSDGVSFGNFAVTAFAAQILSIDSGVGFSNSTLGSTVASRAALAGLLPTIFGSVGLSDGAIGFNLSREGGANPLQQSVVNAFSNLDNNYALDFEFGIVDGSDDFFQANLDANAAGTVIPSELIDALGTDVKIGEEAGGFSVLRDWSGPGPSNYKLVKTFPVGFNPLIDPDPNTFSQIRLSNSTILKTPTVAQILNGWQFADQADIALNAVPEPASLAIFAVVGVAGFAVRRRRS